MKVNYKQKGRHLYFYLELDSDDIAGVQITNDQRKFMLGRTDCKFLLPSGWKLSSTHPDLFGLVAALITEPFVGSSLTLNRPVSQRFSDTYYMITRKRIGPIDKSLNVRKAGMGSVAGLSYSGGFDSTASILLMPPGTKAIFLDRTLEPGRKSKYIKAAAHYACNTMSRHGFDIHMIESDVEYVRNPTGFSTPLLSAAPAIVMADYLDLNSVSYGNILESVYDAGYAGYSDNPNNKFRALLPLFEAAGLPAGHITAGISKVAAHKIVLDSPYSSLASACIRGVVQKPCMNCIKCFRKTLLELTLVRQQPSDDLLGQLFSSDESTMLLLRPTPMETVYAYVTSHYTGSHHLMNSFKRKVRGDRLNVDWLEKWYSPSIDMLPAPIRSHVCKTIEQRIGVMSNHEERSLRSWQPYLSSTYSPFYRLRHRRFYNELTSQISADSDMEFSDKRLRLRPGQKKKVRLLRLDSEGNASDITDKSSFRTVRDHIALVKDGYVEAINPGATIVTGLKHGERAVMGVEVMGNNKIKNFLGANEHSF